MYPFIKHRRNVDARFVLTAATTGLPSLDCDVAVLAAGSSISLKKLALETIHCRVFAQSAAAGIDKRLRVDVLVTCSERGLLQGVAPVENITKKQQQKNRKKEIYNVEFPSKNNNCPHHFGKKKLAVWQLKK